MVKTVHAIYEHGTLRPLEPIEGIEENAEVEIAIIPKNLDVTRLLKYAVLCQKRMQRICSR